jgi:hypothetical protein
LAAPFDPAAVRRKPTKLTSNRALAAAYIDSPAVQDRLDEVLGVDGWQDDYHCLLDGSVVCRLRSRIDGEWLTKVDVGGPSEQPDGGVAGCEADLVIADHLRCLKRRRHPCTVEAPGVSALLPEKSAKGRNGELPRRGLPP